MGYKRLFSFKTDFKGKQRESLGIKVTPDPVDPVTQPFTATEEAPVRVLAEVESQPLRVEVHENGSEDNPKNVNDYYLQLNSNEFIKQNNGNHWLITRNTLSFFESPILMDMVPQKLNKWPVRLFLLPFELVLRVVKFVGELAQMVITLPVKLFLLSYRLLCGPGETNITVGGPEG